MLNKKDEPLVTVHMSAYNHEKYIKEAVESIINQTYENLEFIIINDGSHDSTHIEITKLLPKCYKRFKRFEYRNRENLGLSATKNECLKWAQGKYFTGLASDDIIMSNKVSDLVSFLEDSDDSYAVAFGDAIFIDDNSNEVYRDYKTGGYTSADKGEKSFLKYYTKKKEFNYKDENEFGTYKTLLGGNYLPAMSAVIKLEQIKEVDAWTSGNTIEDWEMWLKLSKNYKFAYVDEAVALYRLHDSNSDKRIGKNIHYDSIVLLKNNKEYAVENNLKDVYYDNLISKVIGIRYYSKKDFVIEVLKHSNDFKFLKLFFTKLIQKITK